MEILYGTGKQQRTFEGCPCKRLCGRRVQCRKYGDDAAVIAAAEAEHAPVILQTTPSTLKYAEPAVFAAMARAMAGKASVPVAMHLDHGDRFGLCQQAASDGYTSLMIDGSKLPLDENIALAAECGDGKRDVFPALCGSGAGETGW